MLFIVGYRYNDLLLSRRELHRRVTGRLLGKTLEKDRMCDQSTQDAQAQACHLVFPLANEPVCTM